MELDYVRDDEKNCLGENLKVVEETEENENVFWLTLAFWNTGTAKRGVTLCY